MFNWSLAKSKLLLPLTLGCALCLGLNGCQSTSDLGAMSTQESFWQNMQSRVKAIKSITLTGRVKVAYKHDRFTTNFLYQGQDSNNYELRLLSGVGKELARIKVKDSKASLFSSGHLYEADNAQELFAQYMDIPLPLNEFHNLILGIAPNDMSVFNDFGILLQSQVDNYVANYRDSHTYQNVALPKEIEVLGPQLELLITTREIRDIEFNYPNN